MNINNVIKEAALQSQKTKYIFRLGAVVYDRHRIISGGYNRVYLGGGDCAEILALKKAPSQLLRGASILVCRVRPNKTLAMAKPCHRCKKAITKAGIKQVTYSTPTGWKVMKL